MKVIAGNLALQAAQKTNVENNGEFRSRIIKMSRPEKEYMNISKVARFISTNTGLVDNDTTLKLMTILGKNIIVNVDLHKNEHLRLSSPNVTQYDMAVLDAVYTLYVNNQSIFSPEMLLRIMSGNFQQDASPQKIGTITRSINKLRHIDIRIDYTDEARLRKLIDKSHTAVITSYLLPVDETEIRAANGKTIHAYRLLMEPALYIYARIINQIIHVPTVLLETNGTLSDTDEVIVLKRYLIKRIEGMRNSKNKLISKKITYEWYDIKTKSRKGMFAELGYDAKDFTESAWRNKKSKLHNIVLKLLTTYRHEGYIKSFTEVRGAKSIIEGVVIDT